MRKMDSTIQRDIMRLTVRGAWELLLHDNADMIDLFYRRTSYEIRICPMQYQ